jgi:hypothetical protein
MKESRFDETNTKLNDLSNDIQRLADNYYELDQDLRNIKNHKKDTTFERICNADGESWFGFAFLTTMLFVLFMIIASSVSKKDIECHYMDISLVENSSQINYKMMGFIDWSFDTTIVSTPDKEEFHELTSNLKLCAPSE